MAVIVTQGEPAAMNDQLYAVRYKAYKYITFPCKGYISAVICKQNILNGITAFTPEGIATFIEIFGSFEVNQDNITIEAWV